MDVPQDTPHGYCHCGCGEKTRLASHSETRRGWVKGEPIRFLPYHRCRLRSREAIRWHAEDRGYRTPCWIYEGSLDPLGYGQIQRDNQRTSAHRLNYERRNGAVPAGLELDHLCRVPPCCNPDHLEAVTHAENIRRGRVTAKLTRTQTDQVRTLCEQGWRQTDIAAAYGISQATASRIKIEGGPQ